MCVVNGSPLVSIVVSDHAVPPGCVGAFLMTDRATHAVTAAAVDFVVVVPEATQR